MRVFSAGTTALLLQVSSVLGALYDSTIETQYGSLQGYPAFSSDPGNNISDWQSISVWKNIPFAASTGGANRWRPPQPAASWSDVRDAKEYGDVCPSVLPVDPTAYNYTVSEDCLNLNIWSPANATDAKLPVVLWSTPAYSTARMPLFDGGGMASQGIVFVNYNRRDGAFGYLAHPEMTAEMTNEIGVNASGNWAVLDQFAALQWVYDNIEAFGGDPEQITAAGQSAGSAATYHMVNSPIVKGLIKRAIVESGVRDPYDPLCSTLAENYITMDAAYSVSEAYLESVNVSSVDELRDVSMETLVNLGGSFHVVLDYYAVPHKYIESLSKPAPNDVPFITGNTKDESGAAADTNVTVAEYYASLVTQYGADFAERFFELYPANTTEQASQAYNAHYRDTSRVSSWLFAGKWNKVASAPFYTYLWDHAPPGQDQGAYHMSEINYVLNNLYLTDSPWEAEDYAIASKMNGYWANFVKTGDPNKGDSYRGSETLANWQVATADRNVTQNVGDSWGEVPIASAAQIQLIEDFFATQSPF